MEQLFKSDYSGKKFPLSDKVSGKSLRPKILELIQEEHPNFGPSNYLSIQELRTVHQSYLRSLMEEQLGELDGLDKTVMNSINDQTLLADQLEDSIEAETFGQRLADRVATFGGSWTFILTFLFFLLLWVSSNVFLLLNKGFDPYPFILLNLILSCIAALQAPVIMMSQNRQEEKDRERSKKDYMINLKSELEIRLLHEKIDHLLIHQQKELLEMQQIQMDMMNEIINRK